MMNLSTGKIEQGMIIPRHLDVQSYTWQVIFVLSTMGASALGFFPLYRLTSSGITTALTIIPVVVAAQFWGLWTGLVAAAGYSLLNTLLMYLVTSELSIGIRTLVVSAAMHLVIGVTIGRLRDLSERLMREVIERKRAEEALHKLNEELEQQVQARTTALQNANRALRESLETLRRTQAQLVQSEKMAALGTLVAGVAHEINTPVGVGVTAASLLEEKTYEIEDLYNKGQMKRSDLEQYLKIASEAVGMNLGNLRRVAKLIQNFKRVAVDQTREEKRLFALKASIDAGLLSLHSKLKQTRHTVTVNCPEDLELTSYPGAISQIIANFVCNSLIHGFEDKDQGAIVLDVTRKDDMLWIRYSDNGKGMTNEERARVFDPFYTTKRGQGRNGLGLHIVYNLVVQCLNGHITCESTLGKGTSFLIHMPI